MSGTNDVVKDLDYYIEHPDEMPTDPDQIARIMGAAEGKSPPAEDPTKTDPAKKTETEEGKDKKGEAAPASADKPDEPKPKGIQTKDGEHVLPYAEMERRIEAARKQGAEESRQAAEAAAREVVDGLRAQLEERDRALKELEKGKAAATPDPVAEISDDLMNTIREEYPTLSKPIEALLAAIKQRDTRIDELTATVQETRESQHKTDAEIAADEVQGLIDQNADLRSWQSERPMLFDLAIQQEAKLMGDKKWVAEHPELVKDDAERHKHVVELVKQAVGLPAASPKNDNADLDRKAEEAVAGATPATPRSLSDIKGGTPPAQSIEENLEHVSAGELASKMLTWTPEQRERFFARLG